MKHIKNYLYLFVLLFASEIIFSDEIEEVIVTADYRNTELNKEDSSIFVLDTEEIKAQPIKHFENLSYLVPNLNFAASDSRARYFQIRGIGERSGYLGTPNTSVGFLIDDVDYSGQAGIATTFDVEQIEIFNGPQGSRIGANALAGLIYIKTKDPTDEFEGTSEITYGNYNTLSTGLAFGGPLTENKNIKFRLALRKDDTDGFRENLYLKRSDTSRKDEATARLKVDFELDNKTNAKLLLSQIDMDDPADIWTIDGSLNTLSDRPGMDSQKTDTFGLKVITDNRYNKFESLTSTTDTDVVFSYDADWGNADSHAPYTYDYFSETLRARESFSQEFRFVSNEKYKAERLPFDWVIGVSYLKLNETNDRQDDGIYGDPNDPFSPYTSLTTSKSDYSSTNISIFGNIDYEFSAFTKLSVGLRMEDWSAKYFDSNNERFSPSNSMMGGKVSLIHSFEDDMNIFANYAKGYKQGGFNVGLGLLDSTTSSNLEYDPEFLTNYEIGMDLSVSDKTDLRIVGFYSERTDQQVLISTQVDPNDPNTFVFLTQNAAEGENYGLELNLNSDLSDDLDIFVNLGLLNTEIKIWESRPEIQGREQAHAPSNSYSFGLNYRPTPETYLNLHATGKSGFYYSDSHNNKSGSYILLNSSFGYNYEDWVVELWVRNLFDEYYATRGFYFGNEAPDFADTLYERHGDPRHFGLSIRYDF
jgi:outer membrane receptor protein involved in Fe transport